MDPIISSLLLQAGKNMVGTLLGGGDGPKACAGRMGADEVRVRFEERLRHASQPAFSTFCQYLEGHRVQSLESLDVLAQRLVSGLQHVPEVVRAESRAGTGKLDWNLKEDEGMYVLESGEGMTVYLPPESEAGMMAERLFQIEELKRYLSGGDASGWDAALARFGRESPYMNPPPLGGHTDREPLTLSGFV